MYWYSDVDQETVLNEAAEALCATADNVNNEAYIDRYPGDENNTIQFRIRLHDERIYLHIGDPSYDKDHRGDIGAGLVCIPEDKETAKEQVKTALNEAKEHKAMRPK